MKLSFYFFFLLHLACTGTKDKNSKKKPEKNNKVSKGLETIYPFKEKYFKQKVHKNCLEKSPFTIYPHGKKIGGIKVCQDTKDKSKVYMQFQYNRNQNLCIFPLDKKKNLSANTTCIKIEAKKTHQIKLERIEDKKIASFFMALDQKDTIDQLKCCINANKYTKEGSGVPFPRCTFEYKINICSEFVLNYKGNYIYRMNFKEEI